MQTKKQNIGLRKTRPQRQESCSEHVLLMILYDSDRTELSDASLSNSFDLDFCYAAMLLLALVVVDLVRARGESPVLSAKLQH